MSNQEPDNMDELHDALAIEVDVRKVRKLVDEGKITLDELANAKVYIITQNCACEDSEPDENNRCNKCLTKWTQTEENQS